MAERRPRRARNQQDSGRPRREASSDDRGERDRAEEAFAEELETRIRQFVESGDEELELEPMNSYRRRLVHQIAKPYNLDSDSRGEDPNRYVCLIRTDTSEIPQELPKPPAPDRSDSPREAPRPRDSGMSDSPREAPRPRDSGMSENPRGAPKARAWDFGKITYPIDPGPDGIRLALLNDGTVEIWQEKQGRMIVDERVVKGRQIRIRAGKIVEPGEEGW